MPCPIDIDDQQSRAPIRIPYMSPFCSSFYFSSFSSSWMRVCHCSNLTWNSSSSSSTWFLRNTTIRILSPRPVKPSWLENLIQCRRAWKSGPTLQCQMSSWATSSWAASSWANSLSSLSPQRFDDLKVGRNFLAPVRRHGERHCHRRHHDHV